ncbi:MAG TPA: type I phosphomannose isomerase catalytic subunit [Chthoniobacterales bacterium]|jgi:mannose-6-phosphate isomerase|nr:type I phosphomannose isomerase catalytic subunit [Chthoniobacterales bacterium]
MERIWGGRKLAELFHKNLPPGKRIGESWEIVDRPEAQSVVASGPLKGATLHELWSQHRKEVFGDVQNSPRFPLLIKLLDAQEKLSLQVHPPGKVAAKLGGEPKTECWYVANAQSGAELFVGFSQPITREEFEKSLRAGSSAEHVHTIEVKTGDAMFLPAGRFHAVGAGNVLVEIQQNSDTTYRVFDWNRVDRSTGKLRQLHVEQALESIDFNDVAPKLIEAKGELLVKHELFELQKWNLDSARDVTPQGQFAIVCCLTGSFSCADVDLRPGEFFLVPASLEDRRLHPGVDGASLLQITIPTL